MRWSLRVFSFAGIGVYVHVTFLLLVAYLLVAYQREEGLNVALFRLGLVLALFVCVLLHEYGHALTARRFGIGTRDIILLPIGGVARLERIPRRPLHEFTIALAGPLVNLALAALVAAVLLTAPRLELLESVQIACDPPGGGKPFSAVGWGPFLGALLVLNIFIACFNLLPAFPMDGGRILRSILAFRLRFDVATTVAARCGQIFALLFILLDATTAGFSLLSLIAILVFIGAAAEAAAARLHVALEGLSALHGAEPEMMALTPGTPLDVAAEFISSSQAIYPVFEGEKLLGLLEASEILAANERYAGDGFIGDLALGSIERVTPETPLAPLFDRMVRRKAAAVAVTFGDRFLAIVTPRSVHACAQRRLQQRETAAVDRPSS